VATAAQNADLIFIGTTKRLDTSAYERPGHGHYSGDFIPEQTIKGSVAEPALTLTWDPSATGLDLGSKHIFLVKRRQGTLEVLKEIYIHMEGFPCCRTYGAMDGGTTITLDAISYLVSPKAGLPAGYNDRLLYELKQESVYRQATAVTSLHAMKEWLKMARSLPLAVIVTTLGRKLQGYWNYYGVIGNSERLTHYAHEVKGLVFKWLNRRSQRRSYTWSAFAAAWESWNLRRPLSPKLRRQGPLDNAPHSMHEFILHEPTSPSRRSTCASL